MNAALTVFFVVFWYGGVVFFAWMIFMNIRTGSAGASGIELLRARNPIKFWIRIIWHSVMLIFMAVIPVIATIRNGGLLFPQ